VCGGGWRGSGLRVRVGVGVEEFRVGVGCGVHSGFVGFGIVVVIVVIVGRDGFGKVGADPDGRLPEEAGEESELRDYQSHS